MKMAVGLEKVGSPRREGGSCGSEGRLKRMNVRGHIEADGGEGTGKGALLGAKGLPRKHPTLATKWWISPGSIVQPFSCPPPLNPQIRLFPLPQPQGTQRKTDSPGL